MATAAAPPYVSLTERLLALGETLNAHGGEIVPPGKISTVLTALVNYVEHGGDLLDQHELGSPVQHPQTGVTGAFSRIEPILTPDRPEGWAPPQIQMDPKDLEIERLRAQLASLNVTPVDPRDEELDRLRAELSARDAPAPAPVSDPDFIRNIERAQQEAAQRGTAQATTVEVEHDPEYKSYDAEALADAAARRGLDVEGTGKDGYVTADDNRSALIADDKHRQEGQN